MDRLADLDECINNLEQLQLTLDFETPTIKRNPKISSASSPPKAVIFFPCSPRYISTITLSPRSMDSTPLFQASSTSVPSLDFVPDCSELIDQNKSQSQDLKKSPLNGSLESEESAHSSQIEISSDLESVSVCRPKLCRSEESADSDCFLTTETDKNPSCSPSSVLDHNNTSPHKVLSPGSHSKDSSPFHSLSSKKGDPPTGDHIITDNNNIIHSDSSSQNISSNCTEKEASCRKSFSEQEELHSPKEEELHSPKEEELHSTKEEELHSPKEEELHSPKEEELHSPKEDELGQMVVRFFTTDKTTKAMLVTETMTVEHIIRVLMEKHFWMPSLKCAVVEKVPSLKMERFFEEDECLLTCVRSWPSSSTNMVFFEPRDDVYGLFENTKMYLGGTFPLGSIHVDQIKDLFHSLSSGEYEYQDHLYIKKPGDNCWRRKFCIVNQDGVFSVPRSRSRCSSPLTVMTFVDRFHLYTSTGGWTKLWGAPTPFGFAFKPYGVIDPTSDQIMMFCAGEEISMKRWCSNLRLCKYKHRILNNYQKMQNRSIYCSNLFTSESNIGVCSSMSPFMTNKSSSRISLPTSNPPCRKSCSRKFKKY